MISEFEHIEGSPLFYRYVKCPICENENKFKVMRERVYVVNKSDEDFRVTKYKWVSKAYNIYNPLYYKLWTCKYCFFTDFTENFYLSKYQDYNRDLQPHLVDLDDKECALINILGEEILSIDEESFYKAIHQFLLAMYIHSLAPLKMKDYDKIAKLSIRLIWVIRSEITNDKSDKMHDFYSQAMTDLNKFKTVFWELEKSYHLFSENSQTGIKKINVDSDYIEKFSKDINRLHEFVDYIKLISTSLDDDFLNFKNKYLSYLDLAFYSGYKSHKTFNEYLFYLKRYWNDLPASEEELVLFMVRFYDKALQTSYYDGDIFKSYNIKKAIIFNLQKIRSFKDAIHRCENTLLHLYKFHKVTMRKIDSLYAKRPNPKTELNKNYTIVKKIGELSQYFQNKRLFLIDELKRSEYAKAVRIIKESKEKSEESLKNILLDSNISEYTISEYFTFIKERESTEKVTGIRAILKKLRLS